MPQVLTLSEARTRDAKERVSTAHLAKWREEVKDKLVELVKAEYRKTEFCWICDLDTAAFRSIVEDALSDATYAVELEIES